MDGTGVKEDVGVLDGVDVIVAVTVDDTVAIGVFVVVVDGLPEDEGEADPETVGRLEALPDPEGEGEADPETVGRLEAVPETVGKLEYVEVGVVAGPTWQ